MNDPITSTMLSSWQPFSWCCPGLQVATVFVVLTGGNLFKKLFYTLI